MATIIFNKKQLKLREDALSDKASAYVEKQDNSDLTSSLSKAISNNPNTKSFTLDNKFNPYNGQNSNTQSSSQSGDLTFNAKNSSDAQSQLNNSSALLKASAGKPIKVNITNEGIVLTKKQLIELLHNS